MFERLMKFLKNDVVFWVFFVILLICMIAYVLKKEAIKITITFSEPYNNKVIEVFGE